MRLIPLALLVCSLAPAGEVRLGRPLTLKESIPVARVNASPAAYTGKVIQVKGKVVDLCRKMGCWMNLMDPSGEGAPVRIKVKDGEIVFPKEAVGRMAVVEGKFVRLDLTREQAIALARHEAEENGRKFDPDSITSGKTMYQIEGTSAVILE